ncbi:hypothetical protein GGD61_004938 [Bradyrhizobium sp. SBR1B]|nr:hypothetical protein [Bradyrhizobium sp. SBR1B]
MFAMVSGRRPGSQVVLASETAHALMMTSAGQTVSGDPKEGQKTIFT